MLEIASESTAERDLGRKRDDYAALGIPEYRRFDETGESYGERLTGDRLVRGEYRPIPIRRLSDDAWHGRSGMLGLGIRWSAGRLGWHDPATSRHIVTFDDERARADAVEAPVRELEEELQRLRGEEGLPQPETGVLPGSARNTADLPENADFTQIGVRTKPGERDGAPVSGLDYPQCLRVLE